MRIGIGYRIGNIGVFASQSLSSIGRTQQRRVRTIQTATTLHLPPDADVAGIDLSGLRGLTYHPGETIRLTLDPAIVTNRRRRKAQKALQKLNRGARIELVFP